MKGQCVFGTSASPAWIPTEDDRLPQPAARRDEAVGVRVRRGSAHQVDRRSRVVLAGGDRRSRHRVPRPFTAVLDDSAGKPLPKWFVGGRNQRLRSCARTATPPVRSPTRTRSSTRATRCPPVADLRRTRPRGASIRRQPARPRRRQGRSGRAVRPGGPRGGGGVSRLRDDRRDRGSGVLRLRRRGPRVPHPQLRGGRAGDRGRDDPPRQARFR